MSNCSVYHYADGYIEFIMRKQWHREKRSFMHPTISPAPFGTLAEVSWTGHQGWWDLLHMRKEWGHSSRIRRARLR